ncbi:MAG: twin-arginine translocation signal domain-containing protein, partial [Dehalococcoidia bacterium]
MVEDTSHGGISFHPGGEEALWEKAKAAGISRRTFVALLAVGGAAAVLAACGGGPTPTPVPTSEP